MLATLRRLPIALASCVFLAWSLQRAVDTASSPDSSEHEYLVAVPGQSHRNPLSAGDDVWLLGVVVEGQVVPFSSLERTGSWDDVGSALAHRPDGQPATVRVRGRQVMLSFLTSKYSGIVRVEGAGGQLDVDLFHPERERTTFVALDLAGGRVVAHGRSEEQDPVRTAWALVPVLLAAAFWRPWRSAGALDAWLLAYVSALHALVWLTQGVGYNGDAHGYMSGFGEFVAGRAGYYPPGYSLLLGPLRAAFPNATGLAVAAVQHVLMILALYGVARVARHCLGSGLASLGLLIAGSVAPTLLLPQVIFSENAAFFGMAGALWFVVRRFEVAGAPGATSTGHAGEPEPDVLRFDIVAGLLIGWAALARVSPLPGVALSVFLIHTHQAPSLSMAVTRTARVLLTAIIVLGLSATWIWWASGRFAIATSSGQHLYSRVVTGQFLLDREGRATQRFLSIMGDRPLKNVTHMEIASRLNAAGLGYDETVKLMGDVALEGARSQPVALLGFSLNLAWREYRADPMPDVPRWASGPVRAPEFEDVPLRGIHASSLLWRNDLDTMFAALWPTLKWMPLTGLLFLPWLRGRLVFLALLAVPAGYLFAGSFADVFVQRYMMCVVPFALVLIPVPLAGIGGIWRRLS